MKTTRRGFFGVLAAAVGVVALRPTAQETGPIPEGLEVDHRLSDDTAWFLGSEEANRLITSAELNEMMREHVEDYVVNIALNL